MSRFWKLGAVVAAAALVGTTAAAISAAGGSRRGSAARGARDGNAQRFLALTGDGRSPQAARTGAAPAGRSTGPTLTQTAASGPPACAAGAPTTPAGWCLTPAGTQYTVLRFPIGLTVDPVSGEAIVSSDSGGPQALDVINPSAPDPSAAVTFSPGANLFLGLSLTGDGTIYASGGNSDRVFRYHLAGPAAVPQDATEAAVFPTHNATNGVQARITGQVQAAPVGDGVLVGGYPGESVADDANGLVYVGGTLSEASGSGSQACAGTLPDGAPVPACARVTVIRRGTQGLNDAVAKRVAVGADTYGLALDKKDAKLFVANWGDQASRGAGRGTVSVLALDPHGMPADHESKVIPVGHHPEALVLSPDSRFLYVTDTNDDSVTVIDTATDQVVEDGDGVIDVGTPEHAVGTQPDALAVSRDGGTLFVALAGINAVQVIHLDKSTGMPVGDDPTTYIPTGWYPSALAAVSDGHGGTKLWVANAKGVGYGPGFNGSVLVQGTMTAGTVDLVSVPTDARTLQTYTAQVIANDGLREQSDSCDPSLHPSKVLCPDVAGTSPIKHVVYILVENKTFDSYFGDINTPTAMGYDADPKYLLFGQPVTPNQHKVLTDHVGILGDNFYSDAEVSVTGHSWAAAALATDHNEKTWPADYDQGIRGTHGNGDPLKPSVAGNAGAAVNNVEGALYDPQPGFIFERFVEAGAVDPATKEAAPDAHPLSMAIYGEHTTARVGPQFQAGSDPGAADNVPWKAGDIQYFDTCRAKEFIGVPTGGGHTPDTDQTRDCEQRTLAAPFTLKRWEQLYASSGKDVMPNFIFMSLPDNHTLGTNLGSPTPQSMVADNDNAIGLMVQAISQSPFWSSTAVVIVQDDTQLTGDHVNPMRDPLEVVSPYAATTPDHQRGSMGSILRTVEVLFGVRPVGVNDELAAPLHGAFVADPGQAHSLCNARTTLGPDGTYPKPCYTAAPELVPFAVNQPGAPGQAASMAMDWSQVDRIDMATLNAIWWATQHHTAFKMPAQHPVSRDSDG